MNNAHFYLVELSLPSARQSAHVSVDMNGNRTTSWALDGHSLSGRFPILKRNELWIVGKR